MPVFDTKEQHNDWYRAYLKKRYKQRMTAAIKKLGGRCVGCGRRKNLQLDHIDRKTKVAKVTNMTYLSEGRFWKEVEKCQLLCARCHLKKTLKERGYVKRHGTRTMYKNHGCRCEECRAANAKFIRAYRSKVRQSLV